MQRDAGTILGKLDIAVLDAIALFCHEQPARPKHLAKSVEEGRPGTSLEELRTTLNRLRGLGYVLTVETAQYSNGESETCYFLKTHFLCKESEPWGDRQ